MLEVTKCRLCGAAIVWVATPSGRRMPCDPAVLSVVDGDGQVVRGRVSHWSTCERADEARAIVRERRKEGGGNAT